MRTFLIIILTTFVSLHSLAQLQIAVQNPTGTLFFNNLPDALANAASEGVIYLPGGVFDTQNAVINKKLRIIGIGHNSNGNPNGAYTRVIGNVSLAEGASGTSFEGLYLTGTVKIGTMSDLSAVSSVSFIRCNFIGQNLYLSEGAIATTGVLMSECILDGVNGGNAENVLFLKCIVKKTLTSLSKQATFRNSIFLYDQATVTFYEVSNATFENNIFLCEYKDITNSSFLNNIFEAGFEYTFDVGNNNASGNLTNIALADIFVNVPDKTFSYDYNYQLKSNSVGVGAGSDGKNIGIYGTNVPFKNAGTPDVPHVDNVNIGSSTDSQGRLSISVKVSAQGN